MKNEEVGNALILARGLGFSILHFQFSISRDGKVGGVHGKRKAET